MVLSEIILGLTIKLQEVSVRISKSGQEEVAVELMSCRDGVEIAIRYESDGIKKIVAIIHLLISMFNIRDMYYRDLILDGQDEIIYGRTNSPRIARAFRKAGE